VTGSGPRTIAVALGSNLGDRAAALRFATARLTELLDALRVSSYYETGPEGPGVADHPPYLNAAATGLSCLTGSELLAALLQIERDFGRERPYPLAPRTLDLDLILAGGDIIDTDDLKLPHPRFRTRLFVLDPLVELAPDLRDPVTGKTIAALAAEETERRRK
jgi:2-amino-4-hydroxy-6-hydroxymethyldihydropteridine diphosphokinase